MNQPEDPVILAAFQNYKGDEESQLSGRKLVESLHKSVPKQEQDALLRWNAQDARKSRLTWIGRLNIITVMISITMLVIGGLDLWGYFKLFRAYNFFSDEPPPTFLDAAQFTAHQQLLLGIHSPESTAEKTAKTLWDSNPNNPSYFANYGNAYMRNMEKLPQDFLDQARQIDPNNAFFLYWAANVEAKDSVKKETLSKAAKAAGTIPGWVIQDEAAMNRALSLLRENRNQQDFNSCTLDLLRERIPLLPQNSYLEYYRSVFHLSLVSNFFMYHRDLSNALAAKAWSCGENGNSSEFLELKKDMDNMLDHLIKSEPGNLVEAIIIEVTAKTLLESFSASAKKLGLAAEAAEARLKLDRLNQLVADRKAQTFLIDGKEADQSTSYLQSSLNGIARRALQPPKLTDEDVRPGRMVDHGLLAQVCVYGACVFLGVISAGMALYRLRSPRVIRGLSKRMLSLLHPADSGWLFLSGLIPFVGLGSLLHFSKLGGSQLSLSAAVIEIPHYGEIPLGICQFSGLLLLMLISQILVVRWRLSKRTAFLDYPKPRFLLGLIVAFSTCGFTIVLGWSVIHQSDVALKIAWGLLGLPLAWLLALFVRAMTGGGGQQLHLTLTSRVLISSNMMAICTLLLATPYFQWSRQYWFERDQMARLDVAYPSLTKFEYQISVAARKELREALGNE